MKMVYREEFLKDSVKTLGEILDSFEKLPICHLKDLQGKHTVFVMVDMVNGFAREGALKSTRVENLIPVISALSMKCDELKIPKLAFADCHTSESPEFDAYPAHCLKGTHEGEIVDEIKEIGGYTLIPKNSTNGFLEEKFQNWLNENKEINTFIVAGDCTDICIQQFTITLKTYFNQQNRWSSIIVPANAVETYDLGQHNGDLMHVFALYNMQINGIEIVRGAE